MQRLAADGAAPGRHGAVGIETRRLGCRIRRSRGGALGRGCRCGWQELASEFEPWAEGWGIEAVVPDLAQTAGQGVQQEAGGEGQRAELGHLAVAGLERCALAVEGDEAGVVSRERTVVNDLLRTAAAFAH
jgi:hypothetical protein